MALLSLRRSIRSLFRSFGIELSRYRPQTDKWLAQKGLLSNIATPIILDIGANIGQTLEAYKELFPNSEVHSFEPFPDSFHALEQVASRHTRAYAHQLAMAAEPGERTFYINTVYHATNSLLPRPSSGHRYYPEGAALNETIIVKANTLDSFCGESGLSHIDVLKMDIQGGELAALRGGVRMLDEQAVGLIITEVMFVPHYEGGVLFHEIHDFLHEKGYSLFGIYDPHYADNGQMRYADAIFINRNLRSRLK